MATVADDPFAHIPVPHDPPPSDGPPAWMDEVSSYGDPLGGGPPPKVAASPYQWTDPATLPRRLWIFGRQIMRGQVGGKFAPGGAGKTTHEVAVCLSLVTGRDFMGAQVWGGPKRAWLWNLEDSTEELTRIVQATCKHWSIKPADLGDRLYVDSALDGAVLKLATQTKIGGITINEPLVAELIRELTEREIDYLSVDPFISSHNVEENDNGAIDAVVKKWAWIAKQANCAITLTHHVKKLGGGEARAEDARGASSLVAACRSALVLNRMTEAEAKGWGIETEERRRFFRVYDDKNNRAPPADKSDWFRLASVDLGNGGNNGMLPGDSIGVVEPWSPPDAFEDVRASDLLAIQKLIFEEGDARRDAQAKRWVGHLVARVLGLDVTDTADRKKINMLLRTWINNEALLEVERADGTRQTRTNVEVGDWADGSGRRAAPPKKYQVEQGGAGGARTTAPPAPPTPIGGGGGGGAASLPSDAPPSVTQGGAGSAFSGLTVGPGLVPNVRRPKPHPDDDDDPAADLTSGWKH